MDEELDEEPLKLPEATKTLLLELLEASWRAASSS